MDEALNVTEWVTTKQFSPLTLCEEWPKMARLMFVVCCCSTGAIINGFFVSSFFIENTLTRVGNTFLACTGLCDLIVTAAIMSTSAVILLSGQWNNRPVCNALHFLGECSTYGMSLFFMLAAVEIYYKICRTVEEYKIFTSLKITVASIAVSLLGVTLSAIGVYMNLDYDYCERKHYGHFSYRIVTGVLFHLIPFIVTISGLIAALTHVRRRARKQIQYRRSYQYRLDSAFTAVNLAAYLFYVVAWMPYNIIVIEFPGTTDSKYYPWVWVGLMRSTVGNLIYALFSRTFRRTYGHLYNYCFCKNTLSGSMTRQRRCIDYRPATGEVRVHIMHHALNISNPSRYGSSSREVHEL